MIAICLMFKDENEFLQEFLNYHKSLGFDKVILYDNNSKITPVVDSSFVIIENWTDISVGKQQRAYNHCINKYRSDFDWIAFIDTDEYIILKNHKNIKSFLKDYDHADAVGLNWLVYGSSYLEDFKSHRDFYMHSDYLDPINEHIKSIVKTKKVPNNFFSLHHFPVKTVNVNNKLITTDFSKPPVHSIAYIKHCLTRTRKEFERKMIRGRGDGVRSYSYTFEETEARFNKLQIEKGYT